MSKLFIKGLVTKADGEGKYKVLASTAAIDRVGDSIDQNGWELDNFKKNPVMPWAHDYTLLPIAKVTNIYVSTLGLEAEFEFAPAEGNPMAQQVKVLYDQGYLNAVSVGFIPKQRNGNVITKAELLEISFVPVPANQEALRLAIKSIGESTILDQSNKEQLSQTLEKGAVSEELDAVEAYEAKCEKWEEVMEAIRAFWTVYFDEATPVEDFGSLLTETIALLQEVVDNDGIDEDDMEEEGEDTGEEEKAITKAVLTPETKQKFLEFISEKAGRTLSKSTMEKIDKAITSMKEASTVLEDLKSSSDSVQDGEDTSSEEKSAEDSASEVEEEKGLVLSVEDAQLMRRTLINRGKDNELALSVVNGFLKSKGIK